jgi:transcriptional regulator with XRE-family HTH domain
MTQAQLATKTGVTREYIARLEARRYDPSLSVIEENSALGPVICRSARGRPLLQKLLDVHPYAKRTRGRLHHYARHRPLASPGG